MCIISYCESSACRRSDAAYALRAPLWVMGTGWLGKELGHTAWERRLKDGNWSLHLLPCGGWHWEVLWGIEHEMRSIEKTQNGNHWGDSGISEQVDWRWLMWGRYWKELNDSFKVWGMRYQWKVNDGGIVIQSCFPGWDSTNSRISLSPPCHSFIVVIPYSSHHPYAGVQIDEDPH